MSTVMSGVSNVTKTSQFGNVLGGIGGLIGGFGQMSSAKSETNVGEYNAQVYEQKAVAERQSQSLLEEQKRRLIKTQIGSQVAGYAKSGIQMSGSPLEVMLDSYRNAEMDIAIDKYNSEVRARGHEGSAALSKYQAAQAAAEQRSKASRSFISTAADLFKSSREIGGSSTYKVTSNANAFKPKGSYAYT